VLVAVVGSYLAVRGELRSEVDELLLGRAEVVTTLASQTDLRGIDLSRLPRPGQPLPPGGEGIEIQRLLPDGRVQTIGDRAQRLPVSAVDLGIARAGDGQELSEVEIDGQAYRLLTVGLEQGGAVQVARSLRGVDDVLSRLRVVLLLVLVGAVTLAGGLAWVLSRRAMSPVAKLTEAAEHVSETNDLSRRIDESADDELGRLASRFNLMLDTIQASQADLSASVDAQKRLVADASHELRTPVASLRTDIESLLQHPEIDTGRRIEMLRAADARLGELTALIADVIELARGEEPDATLEEVRFDLLVEDAVIRARTLFPGRRFRIDSEATLVVGRPDRLLRAVNNLIANASTYSPADSPVEVRLRAGVLTVRDFGPGIPDDEAAFVFDRFFRGRDTREYSGSGLGLAIVRQVARSGGGDAWLDTTVKPGTAICFRPSRP
jgi:two-component system sensor histidine kinase MprB